MRRVRETHGERREARCIGLLLCGGRGERMGSDKGLLRLHGRSYAETCMEPLAGVVEDVRVSLRKDQAERYRGLLPAASFVFDQDLPVGGPLRGLLSVLAALREDGLDTCNPGILALATDMPFVKSATLLALRETFLAHGDAAGIFYEMDGRVEPLCGIYTVSLLRQMEQDVLGEAGSGESQSIAFSLRHRLTPYPLLRLPVLPGQRDEFRNINRPGHLNACEDEVSASARCLPVGIRFDLGVNVGRGQGGIRQRGKELAHEQIHGSDRSSDLRSDALRVRPDQNREG